MCGLAAAEVKGEMRDVRWRRCGRCPPSGIRKPTPRQDDGRISVGRLKARFFAALGYVADEWQTLEADLRTQHLSQPAEPSPQAPRGQTWTIRAILTGPNGQSAGVVMSGSSGPKATCRVESRQPEVCPAGVRVGLLLAPLASGCRSRDLDGPIIRRWGAKGSRENNTYKVLRGEMV